MSRGDAQRAKGARPKPRTKARKEQPATQQPGQGHSARARRTRTPAAETGLRSASFVFRHRAGNVVIFLLLIVAAAQLFNLQVPRAAGLRALLLERGPSRTSPTTTAPGAMKAVESNRNRTGHAPTS